MLLELGDGDAMQGGIQLAVASAVESHALRVARPDGHWRRPRVASKRRTRAKAAHIGCFADQFGRYQHATAQQAQQRWSEATDRPPISCSRRSMLVVMLRMRASSSRAKR